MATATTLRGYTTVTIEFVDPRTNKLEMTARQDMTIPGQNGASVTIKAGEHFTAVRSESQGENQWYLVRHVSGCKKCSCPAKKPCKHEKLVAAAHAEHPVHTQAIQPVEVVPPATLVAAEPVVEKAKQPVIVAPVGGRRSTSWFNRIMEERARAVAIHSELLEIRERQEAERLAAPLNGNKAFSILR